MVTLSSLFDILSLVLGKRKRNDDTLANQGTVAPAVSNTLVTANPSSHVFEAGRKLYKVVARKSNTSLHIHKKVDMILFKFVAL
jgi:hypothetical protein